MNWGNSLLKIWDGWNDLKNGLANVLYEIKNLIPRFLYTVWRLLAWVVAQVEGIFRNLAGIGSSGKDMVSEIIGSDQVRSIFGNLVGFATAVIVFFTIIKIIQDHYKEKDGGNPYKIVIRTFKGLLMFFFVQGAVVVGLKTSQVMFKALDAATGSGAASIAGQVFKAMAASGNRAALGAESTTDDDFLSSAYNKYFDRIASENSIGNDGKY